MKYLLSYNMVENCEWDFL